MGVNGAVGGGVAEGRGVGEGWGAAVYVATGVGVSVAVAVAGGVTVSVSVGVLVGVAVGDCTLKLQPVRTSAHPISIRSPGRITRTNPSSYPTSQIACRGFGARAARQSVILTYPAADAQSHPGGGACVFLST